MTDTDILHVSVVHVPLHLPRGFPQCRRFQAQRCLDLVKNSVPYRLSLCVPEKHNQTYLFSMFENYGANIRFT